MQYLQRKRVKVGVFFAVLLGVLAGSLLFSPSASAKDEHYQYIPADDTIRVTGGVLGPAAGLKRIGSNQFEGGISVPGVTAREPNGNDLSGSAPCTYTLTVDVVGDIRLRGDQPNGAHRGTADIDSIGGSPTPGECLPGDNLVDTDLESKIDTDIVIHNVPDPRGTGGGNACPGSNAPAGTDCSTIPAGCPGTSKPPLPSGTQPPSNCPFQQVNPVDETVEPDPCPVDKNTVMRWLLCPVVELASTLTSGLDKFIDAYLRTGNDIFADSQGGYRKAWETFRTLGIGLVFIAGLIMIASEAFGLQILDAYTIRKMLPRLAIAVLGIALSWTLMEFLVKFFDTLGHAMGGIIYSSFNVKPDQVSLGGLFFANILLGIGAVGGAIALGAGGIISLLGTLALAMLVGAAVLIVRQAIIVAAILLAPLAIASFILPNTSKFANFWWNTFISMMLLYPIATGIIALCKVLGNITIGLNKPFASVVGILFFFAGYALLPAAFRLSGGLVATLGGLANDRTRGGFDRLKNYRGKQLSDRFNAAREGRNGFFGAQAYGALARRATLAGGLSPTARGRARYRAAEKIIKRNTVEQALKNDNNFAAGNDDANTLAVQEGMTRGRFLREYAAAQVAGGATRADAELQAQDALAELEQGYGGQVGSDVVRLAAFKARAASNKGYDFGNAAENYRAAFTDAASLVNAGLISASDAAATIKSNQGRVDLSGIGFGATIGQITYTAGQLRNNVTNPQQLVTDTQVSALANDVLSGSNPGAIIQGRHEAVGALAPHIMQNVHNAAAEAARTNNPEVLEERLAQIGGLYDELSRTSPLKANIFAEQVMSAGIRDNVLGRHIRERQQNGQIVTRVEGLGDVVTVREALERAREYPQAPGTGKQTFLERRREYASRYAAEAAAGRPDADQP